MIPGKASRSLDDLCPCMKRRYQYMLQQWVGAGHPKLVVIETRRDLERQQYYMRTGASQTKNSKHLLGLAVDVCPEPYLEIKGWFPAGPLWEELGQLAIKSGLQWGGYWMSFKDKPHLQIQHCQCEV